MTNRSKHIVLLSIMWLALPVNLLIPMVAGSKTTDTDTNPDTYSFEFRGDPLQTVIETISRVTRTDMMYDPKMIGNEIIFKRIREQHMPGLLSEVLADTPFDYIVLSSGTIVIVRKVSEEPAYGTFTGIIRDSRTGKPLHGASILLADASGGTSTNRNGNFQIGKMISGSYRIVFSYVGYEPFEKVIEILPHQKMETEISLEPGTLTFTPVVVRAHRPNLAGIDRSSSMKSMEAWDVAGGNRDAIRSLNLFPGLQYGLPMQDIHLQGGRQGEHRIRLDGIPVYNPYHFGHFYSAFSPVALGDIQLHKAGFGAEQGSMIAGIIDFQHDIPHENENRLIMLGDPVNINVRGDLSLPFRSGSSAEILPGSTSGSSSAAPFAISATARTNLWDIYQDPTLLRTLRDWDYVDPLLSSYFLNPDWDISKLQTIKQISDITYFDGHLAFRYEPDKYNIIRSSIYFGQNHISSAHLGEGISGYGSNNYLFGLDQFDGSHMLGQMSWDTSPGPRMNISTQIGFSSNRMYHLYHLETRNYTSIGRDHGVDSPSPDFFSPDSMFDSFSDSVNVLPSHSGNNRIDHGVFRSGLSYSLTPEFQLESGIEFNLVTTEVDFSEFFYRPVHASENSTYGALFLNLNRQFGNYWQMTTGSRVTQVGKNANLFFEPRFSLQYDRPDSRIRYWSGRIAGGIYRQFVNQYDITNAGPTAMIPSFTVWSHALTSEPPKAYHLSGSWISKPTPLTSLKLESYYKWEPSGYISSPSHLLGYASVDRSTTAAFSESTRLRSWGASARYYQHLAAARVQLMLGYDYSHAEMKMSQFNRVLTTFWNEPHRIQARSILRVTGPVSVIANWKSVYGRAWGFRQAYYDYLFMEGVRNVGGFSFENPEKDRLSPFHQLDLSIQYRPVIGSVKLDIRADLINVLNRRNEIDWSLQPVNSEGDATPDRGLDSNGRPTEYKIRERTMPGFYPTFRIEVKL